MGYHWDLFWMLTRTEFRMRDQGTWAGFVWTLLHPLFIFAILNVLFTQWMGSRVEHYAAYLLVGIVQWNFFSTATSAGLTCLRRKAPLIAHHDFPRLFVVLSAVFSVLLSHLLEWVVLFGALLLMGIPPTAFWLLLPAVLVLEVALATGISCLLSIAAVHVRDLDRVWGIALYGLFFMTPVFYTADVIGGAGRRLVALNPMSAVIAATRDLVLGGRLPSLAALLPSPRRPRRCAPADPYPRLTRGIVEIVKLAIRVEGLALFHHNFLALTPWRCAGGCFRTASRAPPGPCASCPSPSSGGSASACAGRTGPARAPS